VLKYKVERVPGELKISLGAIKWRNLFVFSILFALFFLLTLWIPSHLSIATLAGVLMDVFWIAALFISGFVSFICAAVVIGATQTHRFVFSANFIRDETYIFGIFCKVRSYDAVEVHSFGYGLSGHAHASILKFWVPGYQQVILAYEVTEGEAEEFVAMVANEGFVYPEKLSEERRFSLQHPPRLYTEV